MTQKSIAQNPSNDFPYIPACRRSRAYRRLSYGVGVNDAWYITQTQGEDERTLMCPYYGVWRRMMQRVCCPKFHTLNPTYKRTSIDPSWLSFMSFRGWMENEDWKGLELDKDILVLGNKLYSPERCVFVTRRVNLLLTDCAATRGRWPVGVNLHKRTGRFMAQCHNGVCQEYLGYYDTPEEAHAAYCARKAEVITGVALEQPDDRVKAALLLRAEGLLSSEKPTISVD